MPPTHRVSTVGAALAALVLVTIFSAGSALRAQDDAAKAAPAPQATTTSDPRVKLDNLKLLLRPLEVADLKVECDAWLGLVKAKQTEISAKKILIAAESDGEKPTVEEVATLEVDRGALLERLNVAVRALEAKGEEGDFEPYDKYAATVGALDVDVTDASATWTRVQTWLTNEEGGILWGKRLAAFFGLLIAFAILSRIVAAMVGKALGAAKNLSTLLRNFLIKVTRRTVMIVGIIVALSALEVNIGPLLALLGAAGFVIAFALQGTLSNLASGLLILFARPYDVGDVIDVAGVVGKVIKMSLFSTQINTADNRVIVVPNNSIWGGIITNITGEKTRRVDMVFGIGYDDDIDKAQKVLEEIVSAHELVLADPEPTIQLHELADSSVNFVCRPWSKTEDYWTVLFDVTRAVKKRFDEEGISIPFPQQDVHMHQISS